MSEADFSDFEPVRLRPGRRELTPDAGRIFAAVMAVLLIGALTWGFFLVRELSTGGAGATGSADGSMTAEQQDRRDVQLAVSSFAANFNNYSVDDIGGYKQRMLPLMTEKFGQSFAYAVDGIVTEVKATKMTSSGKVVQTAVSSIDADAGVATALVVADVEVSSALGDRERHFRWKVSMVHDADADQWLVDDFQPVA